jgi:hypothetical protein
LDPEVFLGVNVSDIDTLFSAGKHDYSRQEHIAFRLGKKYYKVQPVMIKPRTKSFSNEVSQQKHMLHLSAGIINMLWPFT